mmetsp:Transcript_40044/g.127422  ORF Transcript_40044/g.127422 Transcript_40044/m.127422 type:complete len:337 (+) Transcript_40044:62-1072(+)
MRKPEGEPPRRRCPHFSHRTWDTASSHTSSLREPSARVGCGRWAAVLGDAALDDMPQLPQGPGHLLAAGPRRPAPGVAQRGQVRELRHLQSLCEGVHGLWADLQIQAQVTVFRDESRQQPVAELEPASQHSQAGLGGHCDGLGANVFTRGRAPAEGHLLHRGVLVEHVADAEDVLPRLPRVARVEVLRHLRHGELLGLREHLLHVLGSEELVPHGPEAFAPARHQRLPGVDHGGPQVPLQQRQQVRGEAPHAVVDPGALGVRHDDAARAARAGAGEEPLHCSSPSTQLLLKALRQARDILHLCIHAPFFEDCRGGEERVVPIKKNQRLLGLSEQDI